MYPKPPKKYFRNPSSHSTANFQPPPKLSSQVAPWDLETNEYPAASKLQVIFNQHNQAKNLLPNPIYISDSVLDLPDIEAYTENLARQSQDESPVPPEEYIEHTEEAAASSKIVVTQRSDVVTQETLAQAPEIVNLQTQVTQQSDAGVRGHKSSKSFQYSSEKSQSLRIERRRQAHRLSSEFKGKHSSVVMSSTRHIFESMSGNRDILEGRIEKTVQDREKTPKKSPERTAKTDTMITVCHVPEKALELSSLLSKDVVTVSYERKKLIREVISSRMDETYKSVNRESRASQLLPLLAVLNNGHNSRRIFQSVDRSAARKPEVPKHIVSSTIKLDNIDRERNKGFFSAEKTARNTTDRSMGMKTVVLSLENKILEEREVSQERTPGHQNRSQENLWLFRNSLKSARQTSRKPRVLEEIGAREISREMKGSMEMVGSCREVGGEEKGGECSASLSPKLEGNKVRGIGNVINLKNWKRNGENSSAVKSMLFGPQLVPVYVNDKMRFMPTDLMSGFPGKKIKHSKGKKELRPSLSTQLL